MVDDSFIKREKQKVQKIKSSKWWQNKISSNPSCYYCGKVLTKKDITMDHIVPLSQGGKSVKSNLVICCRECNIKKKDMDFIEWLNQIKKKNKI